jgi:TupA-like ATPgrasp
MGRRFLRLIWRAVALIAPSYATTVLDHYHSHGNIRLFLFPRTFNELIQHKKIFQRNDVLTFTSDKWRVRQYVKEKIGERYLVRLWTVAENPQSIDFNSLPNSFVVKANHGSGFNLFVDDKTAADRAKIDDSWRPGSRSTSPPVMENGHTATSDAGSWSRICCCKTGKFRTITNFLFSTAVCG